MKMFVAIATDDFDKMLRLFGQHEIIETYLNFQHSPSTGMVIHVRGRDPEAVIQGAKDNEMRAGGFSTEEGAIKGLRRVLRF